MRTSWTRRATASRAPAPEPQPRATTESRPGPSALRNGAGSTALGHVGLRRSSRGAPAGAERIGGGSRAVSFASGPSPRAAAPPGGGDRRLRPRCPRQGSSWTSTTRGPSTAPAGAWPGRRPELASVTRVSGRGSREAPGAGVLARKWRRMPHQASSRRIVASAAVPRRSAARAQNQRIAGGPATGADDAARAARRSSPPAVRKRGQ